MVISDLLYEEGRLAYFTLSNESIAMTVTNLGCRILSLSTRDREGRMADILLSYANVEDCHSETSMMGAVVGRVANRIANGRFVLNGKEYSLTANEGRHHLHGGSEGFDQKYFRHDFVPGGLRFAYHSPDGEEGYPGNLDLTVTYLLEGNALRSIFDGESDQDTLLNVTSHPYFNLTGGLAKIYDHELWVDADRIACIGEDGVPAGEFMEVAGTPFDFRKFRRIGEGIDAPHPQILRGNGYDHAYFLNKGHSEGPQAILREPETGRRVSIVTDMPTIQVYSGNFLAGGCPGRHGLPYENRDGIALEAQFMPNSINVEEDSGTILREGEKFHSETRYIFDTM